MFLALLVVPHNMLHGTTKHISFVSNVVYLLCSAFWLFP